MITYTVRKGDTLTAIAMSYNVTKDAILKANSIIKDPNLLITGWKLSIPTSEREMEIASCLKECMNDIDNLDSFKKLWNMIEG